MHGRVGAGRMFAAGLALLTSAALLPAAGADAATKTKPALATGVDREAKVSFRLEGRRLTVRARAGVALGSSRGRSELLVRCGESVAAPSDTSAATLAVQGGRRVHLTTRRTTLTVALSRDIAARANWCELRDLTQPRTVSSAEMRVRRGTRPGCSPAGRERVVYRAGRALVTQLTVVTADETTSEYYRFCSRATETLEPLGRAGSSYSGSARITGFSTTGRWLAWVERYYDKYFKNTLTIMRLDLDGVPQPKVITDLWQLSPHLGYSWGPLLVTDQGSVVWALTSSGVAPPVPESATLYISDDSGAPRELDRAEPAAALTDVALSPDGRTVTWRNGGVPRSAPLAG